jgi:hypothetical protein
VLFLPIFTLSPPTGSEGKKMGAGLIRIIGNGMSID